MMPKYFEASILLPVYLLWLYKSIWILSNCLKQKDSQLFSQVNFSLVKRLLDKICTHCSRAVKRFNDLFELEICKKTQEAFIIKPVVELFFGCPAIACSRLLLYPLKPYRLPCVMVHLDVKCD